MKFLLTETVNAQPALAFAIATDVKAWPGIISGIESTVILTRDPTGAGTRFRETRRMHGTLATEEMVFAEFDPPTRFVLTAYNHGTRFRAAHEFKSAGLSTEMTLTFSGRPVTRMAHVLTPFAFLFTPFLRRQLASDLADLKRAIETRSSGHH
jgi:Polyketide cyclase / dehydrase and lipid transport